MAKIDVSSSPTTTGSTSTRSSLPASIAKHLSTPSNPKAISSISFSLLTYASAESLLAPGLDALIASAAATINDSVVVNSES